MKVLVTGSDGYIGSVLTPRLGAAGHDVAGVDTGLYRDGVLFERSEVAVTRTGDIRDLAARDLEGFDAVVHLAELSNDPLGQFDPRVTHAINHRGSVSLASAARAAGVARFVYTSSCSVYGAGGQEIRDERSPTNPRTAYAECKVLVERDVGALEEEGFAPTFLRNATAYGPSPSMRFDIVLNNLAGLAHTSGRIAMTSDGSPWRPLVHVDDICAAIAHTLAAPADDVSGMTLNVGSTAENHRVRDIAGFVADAFEGCELSVGSRDGDDRSYRVSFDLIGEVLPSFTCRHTAADGAVELHDLFTRVGLTADHFADRPFTRLSQLEHLVATGRLDADLRWRTEPWPSP